MAGWYLKVGMGQRGEIVSARKAPMIVIIVISLLKEIISKMAELMI